MIWQNETQRDKKILRIGFSQKPNHIIQTKFCLQQTCPQIGWRNNEHNVCVFSCRAKTTWSWKQVLLVWLDPQLVMRWGEAALFGQQAGKRQWLGKDCACLLTISTRLLTWLTEWDVSLSTPACYSAAYLFHLAPCEEVCNTEQSFSGLEQYYSKCDLWAIGC